MSERNENPAQNISDAINIMVRFASGEPMKYPYEWNDFLSWPSKDELVEKYRLKAGLIFNNNIQSIGGIDNIKLEISKLSDNALAE